LRTSTEARGEAHEDSETAAGFDALRAAEALLGLAEHR
jgi:hypothetical protein